MHDLSVDLRGLTGDEVIEKVAALIDDAQAEEWAAHEISLIDSGATGEEIEAERAAYQEQQAIRRCNALNKVRALIDTERGRRTLQQ